MQQQAFELQQRHMDLVSQAMESTIGYGCVSIRPEPVGATLWIDGAEIISDAEALTMPLGVHEFTARWPDGAEATRRVFVPQMDVTYDISYQSTMGESSGRMKYSGKPEVKKTVIVLTKPGT